MTPLTQETTKEINIFLQTAQGQMDLWRSQIKQLDEEVSQLSAAAQSGYQQNMATLYIQWQEVEAAFKEMNQAGSQQWEKAKSRWQAATEACRQTTLELADLLAHHEVPLGWLQGFSDTRTVDSVGWAEGMGKPSPDSEGWVEGMGKHAIDSHGWAEGYTHKSGTAGG